MHLHDPRGRNVHGVSVLFMKPGNYELGSAQSRAGARALLVAREMSARNSADSTKGLTEVIHAARMRARGEVAGVEVKQLDDRARRPDCLAERIRQARERVIRAHGPETLR
jgi:hypothetical protein